MHMNKTNLEGLFLAAVFTDGFKFCLFMVCYYSVMIAHYFYNFKNTFELVLVCISVGIIRVQYSLQVLSPQSTCHQRLWYSFSSSLFGCIPESTFKGYFFGLTLLNPVLFFYILQISDTTWYVFFSLPILLRAIPSSSIHVPINGRNLSFFDCGVYTVCVCTYIHTQMGTYV